MEPSAGTSCQIDRSDAKTVCRRHGGQAPVTSRAASTMRVAHSTAFVASERLIGAGLVLGGGLEPEEPAEGRLGALPAGPAPASSGTAERWSSDLPARPASWRQIASLALMPVSTDAAAALWSSMSGRRETRGPCEGDRARRPGRPRQAALGAGTREIDSTIARLSRRISRSRHAPAAAMARSYSPERSRISQGLPVQRGTANSRAVRSRCQSGSPSSAAAGRTTSRSTSLSVLPSPRALRHSRFRRPPASV